MSLSAGRPTQTSVPPRASDADRLLERDRDDRGRDRDVGAAEALDRGDGILLADVDDVLGAELARGLAGAPSLMSTATTAAPVMRAYWIGEVAEAADAEDGDEARTTRAPETLTAL